MPNTDAEGITESAEHSRFSRTDEPSDGTRWNQTELITTRLRHFCEQTYINRLHLVRRSTVLRTHPGRPAPVAAWFAAVRGVRLGSLVRPRAGTGERRARGGGVRRLPGCGRTGNESRGARSPAHDPDDGPRRHSCPLPARTNPA